MEEVKGCFGNQRKGMSNCWRRHFLSDFKEQVIPEHNLELNTGQTEKGEEEIPGLRKTYAKAWEPWRSSMCGERQVTGDAQAEGPLEFMHGTAHRGVELQVKLSQKRFYLNLTLKMAMRRVDKVRKVRILNGKTASKEEMTQQLGKAESKPGCLD